MSTTITVASSNIFCVGDVVQIGPGRSMPRWVMRHILKDMDRLIVRWFFRLIGKPIAESFVIQSCTPTTFTVKGAL